MEQPDEDKEGWYGECPIGHACPGGSTYSVECDPGTYASSSQVGVLRTTHTQETASN